MAWYEDSSDEEDDEMLEELNAEIQDELRQEEDEPLPGWVPEGAVAWNTSARLQRWNGPKMMGRKISQYIEKKKKFSETVSIVDDKPFVLKPVILTEGPLKGHEVLLKVPTPRADFFSLPPEIRNTIYGLLITKKAPFRITTYANKPIRHEFRDAIRKLVEKGKKKKKSVRRLALPLVNKQIASEALAMIYSTNSFEFNTTRALSVFLDSTPTMRQHLVHISLPSIDTWTYGTSFSAKLPVENLQSLTIESEAVMFRALTGVGRVNLADLVGELVPFLRRWATAHQADDEAKNVLDLVRFKEFKRCRECGSRPDDCQKTLCKGVFFSDRGKEHRQAVSDAFRVSVTETMGSLL